MNETTSQTGRTHALARKRWHMCRAWALLFALPILTSGCDYIGLQPVSRLEAKKEAEGRAIGGACRQAGRALEDCYTFNPQMPKASIFLGWRDMNDYMTQNNLSIVRPEVAPVIPNGRARARDNASATGAEPTRVPAKATVLPHP